MRQLRGQCKRPIGVPLRRRSSLALKAVLTSTARIRFRVAPATNVLSPVPDLIRPLADLSAPNDKRIDVASAAGPRQYFIHGITAQGRSFRPSDWAERLCGVMSCYRPGGVASGRDALIGFSPYVRPVTVGDVKCVVVDERLRDIELKAFNFVMNFARDNELPVYEGCLMPGVAPPAR